MNLFNYKNFHELKPELLRIIIINICLGIAYAISAAVSLSITSLNGGSAIWLPSGMTLAVFLLRGSEIFPAIAIGSTIGLISIFYSVESFSHFLFFNVACITGNYLQPLLATFVINRYTNVKALFTSLNGVVIFIISGFLSPMVSAIIKASAGVYTKLYSQETYWNSFLTMWIASGLTHLIFTPIFLINKIPSIPGLAKIKPKIKSLIILLVVSLTALVFWLSFIENNSIEYILLLQIGRAHV